MIERLEANGTPCCALTFLSDLRNGDSAEKIRKTAGNARLLDDTRATLTVTKPNEKKLAAQLRKGGWRQVATIPRRTGHTDGGKTLGLWYKNTTIADLKLASGRTSAPKPGDEGYCCEECSSLWDDDSG